MGPDVLTHPCSAERPPAPRCIFAARLCGSPEIRIMMGYPAVRMIVFPRRPFSGFRQLGQKIHEREMAFRKGQRLAGPVIHLHVDVVRIVAGPGRHHRVVPDPLQVHRLTARTGSGYGQIPGILQEQRRKRGIIHALCTAGKSTAQGQTSAPFPFKIQIHSVVKTLVIFHVLFFQSFRFPALQHIQLFPQCSEHLLLIRISGLSEPGIIGSGLYGKKHKRIVVHIHPASVGPHRSVAGNYPCRPCEPECL